MKQPKIGLLPLYLKLYDETMPERRGHYDEFLRGIVSAFMKRGIDVVRSGIVCTSPECEAAVARFDQERVDCIVTLHLAYSPSLETVDHLANCKHPLIILDTTMDAGFGPDTPADRIMYNHGIHGVMDLAAMLRRRKRSFRIVAGHAAESTVMDRASELARAAFAAGSFLGSKALRIGPAFEGMGDFHVESNVMKTAFGIDVTQGGTGDLVPLVEAVSAEAVEQEMAADRERFDVRAPVGVHERSVRVGLGLRACLEREKAQAMSVNFLAFDRPDGALDTVPFLEISKAMGRGIGYGGEGDVLTAAMEGALCRGFGRTTFTEIFCPDWQGGTLFLSHMGEINVDVAGSRPELIEKPFPFTPARNPAIVVCAPEPGPATFVNLSPGPDDTFRLIGAPVEVMPDTERQDLRQAVRGWMRPRGSVGEFLEAYSRHGGTHHSALMLGDHMEAVSAFAEFCGMEWVGME